MCKSEKNKIHMTSQYRKQTKIHTNHSKVERKFSGQLENKLAQIQGDHRRAEFFTQWEEF